MKKVLEEFERHQDLYSHKVQPIRHKVFAHAGRLTKEERETLFTKLFVREMESMVVFPLRLHRALFGVYMNGSPFELQSPPTNISDVLNNLPPRTTSTWEHCHAVRDTVEFTAWMKSAPTPQTPMDPDVLASLVRALELSKLALTEEDYRHDTGREEKDEA